MARRLLLADDSITMQKVVELILAEEGFEIKTTNDGEEALAVFSSFKPDIVLADVEMPKINGYQLCGKIKQDPSTSGIPVILLAGAFEQFDEGLAKKVGADDFVIKPFESQELISKINAALTAPAVAEEVAVGVTGAPGIEEVTAEEDLWAMEEILETAEAEGVPLEKETEEAEPEKAIPPLVEEAEHAEAGILEPELPSKDELKGIFEKIVDDKVSLLLPSIDIKENILASLMPMMKESVEKIIRETISDLTEGVLRDTLKVSLESLVKDAEAAIIENVPELTERMLKDTLRVSLDPVMKEAERAMGETLPSLFEKMLREELKGTFESLTKEVEKVIWKTVPDLAETIISKEIERIRSEF